MKRKLFISVIILAIILVFLGYYNWNQKVESTAKKAEERISSPVNKSYTGESSANSNSGTSANEDGTTANIDSTIENGNNQTSNKDAQSANNKNGNEKPTLKEIKDEYYSIFTELEALETSKVDQLVVQAKADYVGKKSTVSELITKYQEASVILEKNADQSFNNIYKQLQYDLEYYGYDTNEAQEFKQAYEAKKQERLSRVLSQINEF